MAQTMERQRSFRVDTLRARSGASCTRKPENHNGRALEICRPMDNLNHHCKYASATFRVESMAVRPPPDGAIQPRPRWLVDRRNRSPSCPESWGPNRHDEEQQAPAPAFHRAHLVSGASFAGAIAAFPPNSKFHRRVWGRTNRCSGFRREIEEQNTSAVRHVRLRDGRHVGEVRKAHRLQNASGDASAHRERMFGGVH